MKRCWLAPAAWLLAVGAGTGSVRLEGQLTPIELSGPSGKFTYFKLLPDEVLSFSVQGPTTIAFRLCQLLTPDQATLPLDVTVVRDQQQQGTVRARIQPGFLGEAEGGMRCSAPLLLTIAVPPGKHNYQMIITGSLAGVAFELAQEKAAGESTLEATPAGDRQAWPPTESPRQRQAKKLSPAPLLSSETELLASPIGGGQPQPPVHTLVLRMEGSATQKATRVAAGLAGMFLVSTAACLVSAGTLEYQAHAEPVQVEAGRLHQKARRAWEAAAVMGALTGVAVVAVVSLIWQGRLDGEDVWGTFRF